jgi:hypothetical protein
MKVLTRTHAASALNVCPAVPQGLQLELAYPWPPYPWSIPVRVAIPLPYTTAGVSKLCQLRGTWQLTENPQNQQFRVCIFLDRRHWSLTKSHQHQRQPFLAACRAGNSLLTGSEIRRKSDSALFRFTVCSTCFKFRVNQFYESVSSLTTAGAMVKFNWLSRVTEKGDHELLQFTICTGRPVRSSFSVVLISLGNLHLVLVGF